MTTQFTIQPCLDIEFHCKGVTLATSSTVEYPNRLPVKGEILIFKEGEYKVKNVIFEYKNGLIWFKLSKIS